MLLINSIQRQPRSLLLWCCLLLFSVSSAVAGILNQQEQAIADNLAGSNRAFIVVDPILTKVARERAADLARRGYFSHTNPDGHGPNYLVEKAGYKLPEHYDHSASGNNIESIAAGHSSASSTWSDWMGSSGHRRHLMAESDFYAQQTSIGVGYYADANSEYGYYWVVLSAPPAPTPTLTINTPAAGAQVTTSQLAVSGRTGGTIAAQSVIFRVENAAGTGPWQTATGVTSWSGTATGLIAGRNAIRVKSLNASGVALAEGVRGVFYMVMRPLTVNISGQGTVTEGFAGTTQRALTLPYKIVATPAAGQLFAGWSGSSNAKPPTLNFTMAEGYTLTANFVPNPFLSRRGGYQGLLGGGAAGSIFVAVAPGGAFTGKLSVNGASYPLAGRFAVDGTATVTIPGGTLLTLRLDVNGTSGVSGSLSGAVTASFQASATFRPASGEYPRAGRYTITLPPDPSRPDSTLPQGDGYGTLVVGKAGLARLAGALADGRPIAITTAVLEGDKLALYLPLYGGNGYVSGSVTLRTTSVSDLDGSVHWSKPEIAGARVHPAPLEVNLPVIGSRYVRPEPGAPVFSAAAGQESGALTLTDGNLLAPIVQPVTLDSANRLIPTRQALDSLRAVIDPATGLFWGSFVHPVTQAVSPFRGVIFQKQNAGFGYFLGSDESGHTSLAPLE